MLHDGKSIRVAVIGGMRIPFCRAHTDYAECSNQEMMTADARGAGREYDLKGQTLGDVSLGAVIKHSADWNLARGKRDRLGTVTEDARRRLASGHAAPASKPAFRSPTRYRWDKSKQASRGVPTRSAMHRSFSVTSCERSCLQVTVAVPSAKNCRRGAGFARVS